MVRRSRAREVALQLLFQHDQNSTPVPRPAVEKFVRDRLHGDSVMTEYCLALYDGTMSHQAAIDPRITETATNWRLSRMHPADRNVLRMATYELLHDPANQPIAIIIDEAVELARRFGSGDSQKFVNGVLDKIARVRTSEVASPAASEPAAETPAEPTPKSSE